MSHVTTKSITVGNIHHTETVVNGQVTESKTTQNGQPIANADPLTMWASPALTQLQNTGANFTMDVNGNMTFN